MPFVQQPGAKLHYRVYGKGPGVLLAFHGYGQESTYFDSMAYALGNTYTIYAFDLFYHGHSTLAKSRTPLRKEFLVELVSQFLEEKQIGKFSLMGFSMGGKFALTLIEFMPEKINGVYLIAPDGISTSFWYNIATYPGFLQQLFKHTVVKPARFFRFLGFMHDRKIVDQGLVRFAAWQMDSLPKRLRVYRSWMGFRTLTFDIKKITGLLNRHQIRFRLFIGRHDRVINGRRLQVFARALTNADVVVLPTGHGFLLQEVAHYLRREKPPEPAGKSAKPTR